MNVGLRTLSWTIAEFQVLICKTSTFEKIVGHTFDEHGSIDVFFSKVQQLNCIVEDLYRFGTLSASDNPLFGHHNMPLKYFISKPQDAQNKEWRSLKFYHHMEEVTTWSGYLPRQSTMHPEGKVAINSLVAR